MALFLFLPPSCYLKGRLGVTPSWIKGQENALMMAELQRQEEPGSPDDPERQAPHTAWPGRAPPSE